MSDLLLLANELRSRNDSQLTALIRRRQVLGQPKDFFDLAQSLLTPKSVYSCLVKLAASEATALLNLLDGQQVWANNSGGFDSYNSALLELGLVVPSASKQELVVLESVASQAIPLMNAWTTGAVKSASNSTAHAINFGAEPEPIPSEDAALGLAAIAAFETQQALTELVLDVEEHLIRHVGKTGFGVGDVKRLAGHLRKSNSAVRGYFVLAQLLKLVQLEGDRWWLSAAAQNYLDAAVMQRWQIIAKQWVVSLGSVGAGELSALLASQPTLTLVGALAKVFPLADESLGEELNQLAEQASGIGFSVSGMPTKLVQHCLTADFDSAVSALTPHLPKAQSTLIVQADLSLIAPGPLETAVESKLRKFAQIEQVSVACTYRLSALSLSHGLECGLTSQQIRDLLAELSSKALPQPVEYLLREAEARFGRLRLLEGKGTERTLIQSTDGLLLTEILNDVRLRPFGFFAITASSLATRFESEVVYFGLRDLGYVPVRIGSDGKVVSPQAKRSWAAGAAAHISDPIIELVAQLRTADQRVGAEPDDQDLLRQIQLALKNKAELNVVLTGRDGAEVEFRVLPTSLANGRLRGLDKKADIERTLPLERIVRVTF
jgi:hypothetical protein